MKKNYCLLMMAFLGLFSVSCHRNVFYEKMVTMEGESWNINNKVEYEFEITDSMTFYDFYINVGNNVDFETQNFYMFMTTEFPNGYIAQDTLGCILSDPYGNWTGKGGRIKENKFLFKPKVRFPQTGKYKFTMVQAMREDDVKGIAYVGITLNKHDAQK